MIIHFRTILLQIQIIHYEIEGVRFISSCIQVFSYFRCTSTLINMPIKKYNMCMAFA
jgi:hypothetical protein